MRRLLRLFSILLVAAIALLGFEASLPGQAMASGELVVASSDARHSHDHGDGSGGHGLGQHCGSVSCVSVFAFHPGRNVLRDAGRYVKFSMPAQDTHGSSAFLEHDPPIPRAFS